MTVIMRIRHGTRGDRHGEGPMLIRDHLDDMVSMADGQTYTSKRGYYRSLKDKGLEIDDRPRIRETNRPEYDTDGLKEAIGRAISNPQPDINGEE